MSTNNQAILDISQTANKFSSSIVLAFDNKFIDAKSILGLFTTLLSNHAYELHVHGSDAEEATKAMTEVLEKYGLKATVAE